MKQTYLSIHWVIQKVQKRYPSPKPHICKTCFLCKLIEKWRGDSKKFQVYHTSNSLALQPVSSHSPLQERQMGCKWSNGKGPKSHAALLKLLSIHLSVTETILSYSESTSEKLWHILNIIKMHANIWEESSQKYMKWWNLRMTTIASATESKEIWTAKGGCKRNLQVRYWPTLFFIGVQSPQLSMYRKDRDKITDLSLYQCSHSDVNNLYLHYHSNEACHKLPTKHKRCARVCYLSAYSTVTENIVKMLLKSRWSMALNFKSGIKRCVLSWLWRVLYHILFH